MNSTDTELAAPGLHLGDSVSRGLCHGIQGRDGRAVVNRLDLTERYREGQINIVLRLSAGADNRECDLVLFAVPTGHWDRPAATAGKSHCFDVHSVGRESHGHEHTMFVGIAGPIDSPQDVIPSFVRLEVAKDRQDFIRDVFASSVYDVLKVRGVNGEGEVGASGVGFAGAFGSDGVSSLIQSGSEVVDSIGGDVSETVRDLSGELDLVRLTDSIRVCLNDTGVWFCVKEGFDSRVKIVNVFLSSVDSAIGTLEKITHG